jgi:hypothetical protein
LTHRLSLFWLLRGFGGPTVIFARFLRCKMKDAIIIRNDYDSMKAPPLLGEPKFVILADVMYNILVLLQKTYESIITR